MAVKWLMHHRPSGVCELFDRKQYRYACNPNFEHSLVEVDAETERMLKWHECKAPGGLVPGRRFLRYEGIRGFLIEVDENEGARTTSPPTIR